MKDIISEMENNHEESFTHPPTKGQNDGWQIAPTG
jgi:hypothetical protein